MIKVVAPNVACDVLDRAIQAHGAAGVSQDTFLAHAWASARTLRLADGPDEVHLETIAKLELAKSRPICYRTEIGYYFFSNDSTDPVPGRLAPAEAAAVVTKAVHARGGTARGAESRARRRARRLTRPPFRGWAAAHFNSTPATSPSRSPCLFLRLFRSLDAIVGGDVAVASAWLRNDEHRVRRGADHPDRVGLRPGKRGCLPGRPPRSRLRSAASRGAVGVWSRPNTSCRRWRWWTPSRNRRCSNRCSTTANPRFRRIAAAPLSALHSVPIWCRVSAGLPIQTRGSDPRCLLRFAAGDDGGCRNGFLAVDVLCRIPGDAVAGKPGRIHCLLSAILVAKGLDLTRPPLNRDAQQWTHPTDYSHCQALADAARDAGATVIRYQSARAPGQTWRCWRVRRLHPESRWKDRCGGSTSARWASARFATSPSNGWLSIARLRARSPNRQVGVGSLKVAGVLLSPRRRRRGHRLGEVELHAEQAPRPRQLRYAIIRPAWISMAHVFVLETSRFSRVKSAFENSSTGNSCREAVPGCNESPPYIVSASSVPSWWR